MLRFDGFTFDPRSGDLVGARGTTRLQPQASALLAMLIEHAGSVVTRAELQQRLWPDTTVEFDDGLNTCIRQIRVALGDDASAPQYVETLPRRGYRFLPRVEPDSPASPPVVAAPVVSSWRASRRWSTLAVAVAGALAMGALALAARRHHSQAEGIAIAIVPFTADTTDPLMVSYQRRLMTQMLANARSEAGWRVVGDGKATHVLSGSLVRQHNNVRIFAQLVLVSDRQHLWAEDIVDTYPFAGNSTIMGDRIEKSVARVLASNPR